MKNSTGKLRKSRSMPEIKDDEGNSKKQNKTKKTNKTKTSKNIYMGRRSLQVTGGVSAKINRKKSRNERDREIYDDRRYLNDDELCEEASTTTRNEKTTYKCIPALEKSQNSSRIFTEPSENEKKPMMCVPVIELIKTDLTKPSKQFLELCEKMEKIEIKRDNLHQEICQILKQKNKIEQVPIKQKKMYCGLFGETWRFIVGEDGNNKYTWGNMMWLVLKSHFSAKNEGREIANCEEKWLKEDEKIAELRQKKMKVLNKIQNYQFNATNDEKMDSLNRNIEFPEEYCEGLIKAKEEITVILNDFDELVDLYPHYKEFWKRVGDEKNQEEIGKIDENVTAMRVWLNTLNDMNEKLKTLGLLLDIGSFGEINWFQLISEKNRTSMVNDLNVIFEKCVKNILDLKGMSKFLKKVEALIGTTLNKTLFLMQKSPATYAEAAMWKTNQSVVDPEMKEWKFSRPVFKTLQLPSLTRIFLLIIAVPVRLVVHWLKNRSEKNTPDTTFLDELTYNALMTDSRECVEEAVKIKKKYDERMHLLCSKCAHLEYFYPFKYNTFVLDVFNKYIHYVNCWTNCQKVRSQPKQLFLRIEKEWEAALDCARSIKSGVESLCSTFSGIAESLIQNLIEIYAENEIDEIKNEFIIELNDNDDDSSLRSPEFQKFTVAINDLLREIKERSVRIFSLLRGALNDIHDAVGYEIPQSSQKLNNFVDKMKNDFCKVQFSMSTEENVNLKVLLLVEKSAADQITCENCILEIAEGRKISDGCILTIPDENGELSRQWNGGLVKITIDEETRLCLMHLRLDLILLISNEITKQQIDSNLKMVAQYCSSNSVISDRFQKLAKNVLLPHLDNEKTRIEILLNRMESEFVQDLEREKMSLEFKLERNFVTAFQVHRDIARIISDSFIEELGNEMIEKMIDLMRKWMEYLELKPVQPTINVPMWAQPALTTLQLFTDNKWASKTIMSDEQFETIQHFFEHFKKKLIVSIDDEPINLVPIVQRQKMSRSTSSKTSSEGGASKLSQMEKLRFLEEKMEKNLRKNKRIGKVTDDREASKKKIRETKAPFNWDLLKEIGRGSFGTVYQAINLDVHQIMAAKYMKIKPETAKLIEDEIDIFRKLNHENLVKYYGIEVIGDEVYILMEYCSLGTLEKYGKMELNPARSFTHSLLRAVQYLHLNKIIHSDIKPANIFLDTNNSLKLGDFGCSSQLATSSTMYGEFQKIVGTPNYMAPEVYSFGEKNGENMFSGYGRNIDIWSVGCTVIQMLTGETPFQGLTQHQISFIICFHRKKPEYPKIAEERNDVQEFLEMCLEFDPKKRASATELLQTTFANVIMNDMFIRSEILTPTSHGSSSLNNSYQFL